MKKKYSQDELSLRLMIVFSKMEDVESVKFVYSLLSLHDKHKSKYITAAINYYDSINYNNEWMNDTLFPIRCMKFAKNYYDLDTKEDIENLLKSGTKSKIFLTAKKRMIPEVKPTTMLLGFNKYDKESIEMHKRLFEMNVNDRIALIVKAIERYVKDGMDEMACMALSFKMIHDSIIEYENSNNQVLVDNLYDLLKMTKAIKNEKTEE